MSRSAIVDQRYRLQAADLSSSVWRVAIHSVSWQGVEELTPVLHFDAAALRNLALDASQRRDLIRATQSSLCSDWIGRSVELRRTGSADGVTISIRPPTPKRVYRPPRLRAQSKPDWPALLWLALFLLAMLALFWLNNSADAFQSILELF